MQLQAASNGEGLGGGWPPFFVQLEAVPSRERLGDPNPCPVGLDVFPIMGCRVIEYEYTLVSSSAMIAW